jgi:aspartate carbamoyltransferase catalytic subunit
MAERRTGGQKSEPRNTPVRFRKKHLLAIADMDRFEATSLLDRAEAFAPLLEQKIKKLDTLRGRTLINLFFENAT